MPSITKRIGQYHNGSREKDVKTEETRQTAGEKAEMKTKQEIIAEWASQRKVEQILMNIIKRHTLSDYEEDLAQDIYLTLLKEPDEKIISLYEKNQSNYYISRLLSNNVNSRTSRYYYLYRRFRLNSEPIRYDDDRDDDDDDTEEYDT